MRMSNNIDLLTTKGYSKKECNRTILRVEKMYPKLAIDNNKIRSLLTNSTIAKILEAANIDVNAALMSTCRTDPLNCGRCALWSVVNRYANEQ